MAGTTGTSAKIPQRGSDHPNKKYFKLVKELFATDWYDIGLELLATEHQSMLSNNKKNNRNNVSEACNWMLELWIGKQPEATWNQLIKALRAPGIELNTVASQIEGMLESQSKASPHPPKKSTAKNADKGQKRRLDSQGGSAAKKVKHVTSSTQSPSSSSSSQDHGDDTLQETADDDQASSPEDLTDFVDQPAKLELFISYGREDITNDFVQKLRDDLKYQNWNVFLDTHNIDHAESLSDKLAKEISKSDGMIIILSKKSCKSKWCEREVKYADQENKKIFVVKREDIDPPPYLKFILGDDLWFSLYDDDQEQYQSVLEKMIRTLKKLEQSKNEH
ncbi:uncharacterized protein [Dysidea avara]|uniref:uncharacterized protein isoform X1 n=1 Tax=Dysidea avara TaxID=196820 RepID=UPI00332007F0